MENARKAAVGTYLKENNIEQPYTAAELQAKIHSGEFTIESAPTEQVADYSKEIHDLLVLIAPLMIEDDDDPESWADSCFVTDESSLGDFLWAGDEDHLKVMSEKLGFEVNRSMYLCNIAARMRGVN